MNKLNVKKLGFACGFTAVLLYLGCIIVMAIAGKQGSIVFFNRFLHGFYMSSIIRMDEPLSEAFIGFLQTFILGWLIGACTAAFYNAQGKVIE